MFTRRVGWLAIVLRIAGAGWAQGETDEALVAKIEAALASRLVQASTLAVTHGEIVWGSEGSRHGDEKPTFKWMVRYCDSEYVTQQAGVTRCNKWSRFLPPRAKTLSEIVSFEVQTADRHERIAINFGAAPEVEPVTYVTSPVTGMRAFGLHRLGLERTIQGTWSDYVRPPYRLERDRTLRGHPCVVVIRTGSELWLAQDLGYAPLRLVQTDRRANASVEDWCDYRDAGGLELPWLYCRRAISDAFDTKLMGMMSVSRVGKVAVGAEQLAKWDAPVQLLPLPAGATLAADKGFRSAFDFRIGFDVRKLVEIADQDCAPWGVSAEALRQDLEFKLPAEPVAQP